MVPEWAERDKKARRIIHHEKKRAAEERKKKEEAFGKNNSRTQPDSPRVRARAHLQLLYSGSGESD